jgi:hypothetical protein
MTDLRPYFNIISHRIWQISLVLVCAECRCAPEECAKNGQNTTQCKNCIRPICCCIDFHQDLLNNTTNHSNTHFTFYNRFSSIVTFLLYAKGIYAAAFGIEVLCIAAAEIGENTVLYLFGFNPPGIAIALVWDTLLLVSLLLPLFLVDMIMVPLTRPCVVAVLF